MTPKTTANLRRHPSGVTVSARTVTRPATPAEVRRHARRLRR